MDVLKCFYNHKPLARRSDKASGLVQPVSMWVTVTGIGCVWKSESQQSNSFGNSISCSLKDGAPSAIPCGILVYVSYSNVPRLMFKVQQSKLQKPI